MTTTQTTTQSSNTSITTDGIAAAKQYMAEVRANLSPIKYQQFQQLLRAVKAGSLSLSELVKQVKYVMYDREMFAGHDSLLNGFATFVPAKIRASYLNSIKTVYALSADATNDKSCSKHLCCQRSIAPVVLKLDTVTEDAAMRLGVL